jgi:hypothetical protein
MKCEPQIPWHLWDFAISCVALATFLVLVPCSLILMLSFLIARYERFLSPWHTFAVLAAAIFVLVIAFGMITLIRDSKRAVPVLYVRQRQTPFLN